MYSCRWYGDGYILIGFERGYVVAVSTHLREICKELFQARHHRDYLSSISFCRALQMAASAGDNWYSYSRIPNIVASYQNIKCSSVYYEFNKFEYLSTLQSTSD